jgi:muramoyltetrapeptide carboxypeptidase
LNQQPAPLKARPLDSGATIGVCAPSGPVRDAEALESGVAWLEAQGYRVRLAPHVMAQRGYLAGDDAQRAGDLLELLRDPQVDGIVLARGGYGLGRFLSRLDPEELREARKLIVGYSDATSLLLYLWRRAGLMSVHGPMLERPDHSAAARERLLALLRGERAACEPLCGQSLRGGRATGRLVGGNLRVLNASLGTPWEIDTRGAILFIEEIGEQPYALDRSLVQLREAGKLAAAAGVAVGHLVDCESERYPDVSSQDAVCELLAESFEGPVVWSLPFGHVADHQALGVGAQAEIDGERSTLRMLEGVVSVEGDA